MSVTGGGLDGKYGDVLTRVKERAEKAGVKWLYLQFTDLLGTLRHVVVPTRLLSNNSALKLDGSSVKGFTGIEESDLVLKPVEETFAVIPWDNGVGRYLCAVFTDTGRLTRDPRYVAEKLDGHLAEEGLRLLASAELEYFIFEKVLVILDTWRQSIEFTSSEGYWNSTPPFNRPKEGYYTPYPKDKFEEFKLEVAEVLEKYFGVVVETVHHEVATSQHEVSFQGGSATYLGDAVQTVKYVAKALAHKRGLLVTFMPKPIHGDNGSGMHVHISLWKNDSNLFYDPSDKYLLSQEARYFIGGLIEHGRALAAFTNPTVNSYKRLVPGYEAPVYLTWGRGNRSTAIRVPGYATSEKTLRVEYRPPDPSANPYLAVSAIVLAGLDGIKKKIEPGDPVEENIYKIPRSRRKELGIRELPRSLEEALDELEVDNDWLRPVFTEDLIETYIELKRGESKLITSYPTPPEVYYYIDV